MLNRRGVQKTGLLNYSYSLLYDTYLCLLLTQQSISNVSLDSKIFCKKLSRFHALLCNSLTHLPALSLLSLFGVDLLHLETTSYQQLGNIRNITGTEACSLFCQKKKLYSLSMRCSWKNHYRMHSKNLKQVILMCSELLIV